MAFSDPQKIIDAFGIREGSQVVDLGSGTGFYSLAVAKAVGDAGKVYAVDIQQDLLTHLKKAADAAHLRNINVIHSDVEIENGTKLRADSIDVVIAANIMFQLEHKEGLVNEAFRILKSGGRVLVVDWADSFGGMGPQESSVFTLQNARAIFEKKGFVFDRGLPAGDHHYGLIFRKS